jgi:hypothetical protein
MKSTKEVIFENALYHKDEYNRFYKEYGEFDRLTCIEFAKYIALRTVIDEAGLTREWDEFLKRVYIIREEFKQLQEV